MNRVFKLKPSTVHETFGDEAVVMNLDAGTYFSLVGTSAVIWALVEGGASESDIIQRLTRDYAGDGKDISSSVSSFLQQLVDESITEIAATPVKAVGVPESPPSSRGAFLPPVMLKYTDMEEMLLLDPIHEVDEAGWPTARKLPD